MPRPRDRQSATGLLPRMEARTRKDDQNHNLLVRSSTGAACGAARGDFCGKSTRASIGLRRVGSHDFQPSTIG